MNTLCIGITNGGPDNGFSALLADFRMMPVVCPDGPKSLELSVEGYEPPVGEDPPVSKRVTITLRRRGDEMLLWQGMVNNLTLNGRPQLRWSKA